MKKLILAILFPCLTLLGANPSFDSFDTNYFRLVYGAHGPTSIQLQTNLFGNGTNTYIFYSITNVYMVSSNIDAGNIQGTDGRIARFVGTGSSLSNSMAYETNGALVVEGADLGNGAGIYTPGWYSTTNRLNGPLNVLAYGADPTGVTNSAPLIQAALDHAKRSSNSVLIPSGTYKLDSHLDFWTGVSVMGSGWPRLVRNYTLVGDCGTGSYTGDRFLIQAWGKQIIEGLVIDGNAQNFTIATNAVGDCPLSAYMDVNGIVNQTQYGELAVADGPFDYGPDGNVAYTNLNEVAGEDGLSSVIITHNIFRNACGSAIKNHEAGARNVLLDGNIFGEYYDHAAYFTGWSALGGTNTPAMNIQIVNNKFVYPTQVRGNSAVKLRNHTSRAVVTGNTFNLPYDAAFSVDAGDSSGSGDMNEIIIGYNSGLARRLVMLDGDSPSPLYHLTIIGNNMAIADYIFGGPFSTSLAIGGDVSFVRNKIRSTDITKSILFLLRGDPLTGCRFSIEGNEIYGATAVLLFGTIPVMNIEDNKLYNMRTPAVGDAINFVFVPNDSGLTPGSATWTFKKNYTWNYARLLYDDSAYSTDGGTNVLAAANLEFSENTMEGSGNINALFEFAGTFNETNDAPNRVYVGWNRAEMVPPGIPIPMIVPMTLEAAQTNMTASALVLNNSSPFGVSVPSAGVSIQATRFRGPAVDGTNHNVIGEIQFSHERTDTAGYGRIGFDVSGVGPGNALTELGYLGLTGSRYLYIYQTNFTGGIGTSPTPWSSGAVWNVIHSTTGQTPFSANIGGSATVWQFGQNAGVGSSDNDFGFYNNTYGAGHGSLPVLQLNYLTGKARFDGTIDTGFLYSRNLIASALTQTDGTTNLTSIPNDTGALINNGSGGFSYQNGITQTSSWTDGGATNWTMVITKGLITSLTHTP